MAETKFDPIHGRPCVHPGTKFKVLIAYFKEIDQQSDSFPFVHNYKNKQTKTLFSVILLNVLISHKEIRYLITTQPILTLIVLKQ